MCNNENHCFDCHLCEKGSRICDTKCEYIPATKKKVISYLDYDMFADTKRSEMMEYLKKEYNYDYYEDMKCGGDPDYSGGDINYICCVCKHCNYDRSTCTHYKFEPVDMFELMYRIEGPIDSDISLMMIKPPRYECCFLEKQFMKHYLKEKLGYSIGKIYDKSKDKEEENKPEDKAEVSDSKCAVCNHYDDICANCLNYSNYEYASKDKIINNLDINKYSCAERKLALEYLKKEYHYDYYEDMKCGSLMFRPHICSLCGYSTGKGYCSDPRTQFTLVDPKTLIDRLKDLNYTFDTNFILNYFKEKLGYSFNYISELENQVNNDTKTDNGYTVESEPSEFEKLIINNSSTEEDKAAKAAKEFLETIKSLEGIEFDPYDFDKLDKYTECANHALKYIASIGEFLNYMLIPGYISTDIFHAYIKAVKLINTCITKGYYELIPIDPTAKSDDDEDEDEEEIVNTSVRRVNVITDEEAIKESSVKFDFLYTLESDTDFYDAFVELIQYYHKTLVFKRDLFIHFINELQNKTQESPLSEYSSAGMQAKCMLIHDIDIDHDEICFKENRWSFKFQFNKPEYSINVEISNIISLIDFDNIF